MRIRSLEIGVDYLRLYRILYSAFKSPINSLDFTGWVDVDLTAKGEAEAKRGGELLKEKGLLPEPILRTWRRMAGS